MIWVHTYNSKDEALEGLTQQLFKHIQTTRFIIPPKYLHIASGLHRAMNEKKNHLFIKRFFLAIPGRETGEDLLNFWHKNHSKNPIWKEINYYQTNEQYIAESKANKAQHNFFTDNTIPNDQIHMIEPCGDAQRTATLYCLNLPQTSGLYYQTLNINIIRENDENFDSLFHCAIINIEADGRIGSINAHDEIAYYGPPYTTINNKKNETDITISLYKLFKVPRIMILLLHDEKEINIRKLIKEHFSSIEIRNLLSEHPNIHIFTTNKRIEKRIRCEFRINLRRWMEKCKEAIIKPLLKVS